MKISVLPRWWFVIDTCQKGKSVAERWLCLCSQLQKKHAFAIVCYKFLACVSSLSLVSFNCLLCSSSFHCLMLFMGFTTFTNLHFFLAILSWKNFPTWFLLFFPFWPLAFCDLWFFGVVTANTNFWTPIE